MFDVLIDFFSRPEFNNPFTGMWFLLAHGGWFVIGLALIKGLWELWYFEIKNNYASQCDYILLAIDVPKQTEQTPKAVESIFAHLTGLYKSPGTLYEQYWLGENQQNFAMEIVSHGGYVQFIVFIERRYRDLFEASIFAQYPDAEIKEVPDYATEHPRYWPDEKYKMYGAEMALMKPDVYPIKTHMAFTDQVSGLFKDPLASVLDFLASIKPGEEVWIQIPMLPINDSWAELSKKEVRKLIGEPETHKVHSANPITNLIQQVIKIFFEIFHMAVGGKPFEKGEAQKAEKQTNRMLQLSPGERAVVEQVQLKASKPLFLAKIRTMYIAPKELFDKKKFIAGINGSFRQFSTVDLNGFKTCGLTKTKAEYVLVNWRTARKQNKLMRAYLGRSNKKGGRNFVFNIEELATLWHFPLIDTKTPLISKAASKRAEPPRDLPVEDLSVGESTAVPRPSHGEDVPDNIPFM